MATSAATPTMVRVPTNTRRVIGGPASHQAEYQNIVNCRALNPADSNVETGVSSP